MRAFWFGVAIAVGLSAGVPPAGSAAIITTADRGWYNDTGFHIPDNPNYITGFAPADPDFPDEFPAQTFHSFFTFNVPSLSGPFVQAALVAYNPGGVDDFGPGYSSPDASETITLFGVTTPMDTLISGAGGVAAYTDLGTGPVYGSGVVTAADNGRFVRIELNPTGLAALNAARGGSFAIGGAVTTLSGQTAAEEFVFGFSGFRLGFPGSPQDGDTFLDVVSVPVPAGLLLGLLGAAPATALIRRRTTVV
ncbi:MAG: hypothetical protein U0871_06570 [Gemmataceae bacterium]